jgi:hypothetical protein
VAAGLILLGLSLLVPAPAAAQAAAAGTDAPPPGWTRHQHPAGAFFDHPSGWQVLEQGSELLLVPPDLQAGREGIAALAGPARGAGSPTDPEVVAFVDAAVARLNPSARRAGPPEARTTRAGEGALFTYRGPHPVSGVPLAAHLWVVVTRGTALGFGLAGEAALVDARRPVVDRIFASLGVDEAQVERTLRAEGPRDPALLGAWYGEAVHRGGPGEMFNTRFTWHFREDGTILSGAQSAVNIALQGESDVFDRGGATGEVASVTRGRWTAENGQLTIAWDDGSRRVTRYAVRGSTLELRDANGRLVDFMER